MSKVVDGEAPTDPQLPHARARAAALTPTAAELQRALGYVEADVVRHDKILVGDGARDLGLRGDQQATRAAVDALAKQVAFEMTSLRGDFAAEMGAVRKDVEASVKSRMPWWVTAVFAVAAVVIAGRAVDATGREWGWWSSSSARTVQRQ